MNSSLITANGVNEPPGTAAVVRKHVHDARNHLNALELNIEVLLDGIADPETEVALQRMQGLLGQVEKTFLSLLSKVPHNNPSNDSASLG